MKNNSDAIGIVLIFFVFAATVNNAPTYAQRRKPLLPAFNMENIIKEFHKMTDAMGKVDNLGQMALSSSSPTDLAKNIAAPALPDIGNMADALGPLLKNLTSQR